MDSTESPRRVLRPDSAPRKRPRTRPAAPAREEATETERPDEPFRRLVENSLDIIVLLGRDGRLEYASPSLTRALGYSVAELAAKNLFELIHPEDLLHARALFEDCLRGPGRPVACEARLRHRDGSWRYLEGLGVNRLEEPAIGAVIVNFRDVTERRRSLEERHVFFNFSADMLCIAGFDGYFKEANHVWPKALGYTIEELKERPVLDLVHPDDRIATAAAARKLMQGREVASFENRFRCRDGSYRWLLWSSGVSTEKKLFYAVARDITDRKQEEERLRHDAFHDPLTGLANRAVFLDRVRHHLARALRRPRQLFAVLFLDIDSFKVVNDQLGHAAGDQLLTEVGRRLQVCVRPGDLVVRLSGDEFAILLEDIGAPEDSFKVTARIEKGLSYPFRLGPHQVDCSASIGVALNTHPYEAAEEILQDADSAMYQAKAAGKARTVLFRR